MDEGGSELNPSAFWRMRVVAVTPGFADPVVGPVDAEFAFGLLGQRTGSLDGGGLGAVDGGSALASGALDGPASVWPVGDVVILVSHEFLLSVVGWFRLEAFPLDATSPRGVIHGLREH